MYKKVLGLTHNHLETLILRGVNERITVTFDIFCVSPEYLYKDLIYMPDRDDNKYTKGTHELKPFSERMWKTFFANPIIIDILKRSPFLANTVVLVFLGLLVFNLYFERHKTDIPVTNQPITNNFNPVKKDFEQYQQKEITQDDMQSICEDPNTLKESLKESGFIIKNPDTYEAKLIYNEKLTELWPVYRWQCVYRKRHSLGGRTDDIRTGLDLDKFCKDKYGNSNLNRASHKIYSSKKIYCSKTK